MLRQVLKKNHENFRKKEQKRFERECKSRDSNCMSCEEIILECLEWNQKNHEEKVKFMIKTPVGWKDSFLKATTGYQRLSHLIIEQKIPVKRPQADALTFVNYIIQHHKAELLDYSDVLDCEERLYHAELSKTCDNIVRQCLIWNSNRDQGKICFLMKTPASWYHQKIKPRPKFEKVTDEVEPKIAPVKEPKKAPVKEQKKEPVKYRPRYDPMLVDVFYEEFRCLHYGCDPRLREIHVKRRNHTSNVIEIPRPKNRKRRFRRVALIISSNDAENTAMHSKVVFVKKAFAFEINFDTNKKLATKPVLSSERRKPRAFEINFDTNKKLATKPVLSSEQRKPRAFEINFDTNKTLATRPMLSSEQRKPRAFEINFDTNKKLATRPVLSSEQRKPRAFEINFDTNKKLTTKPVLSSERRKPHSLTRQVTLPVCNETKKLHFRYAYKQNRFRFSMLHRLSHNECKIPVFTGKKEPIHIFTTISRIPIRIDGYIWDSILGKDFPAPVLRYPGSMIPARKIVVSKNRNVLNADIKRTEKRKSKIPVRIHDFATTKKYESSEQGEKKNDKPFKMVSRSKLPVPIFRRQVTHWPGYPSEENISLNRETQDDISVNQRKNDLPEDQPRKKKYSKRQNKRREQGVVKDQCNDHVLYEERERFYHKPSESKSISTNKNSNATRMDSPVLACDRMDELVFRPTPVLPPIPNTYNKLAVLEPIRKNPLLPTIVDNPMPLPRPRSAHGYSILPPISKSSSGFAQLPPVCKTPRPFSTAKPKLPPISSNSRPHSAPGYTKLPPLSGHPRPFSATGYAKLPAITKKQVNF